MEAMEKETVINFNEKEDEASFYTCNQGWMIKMERLGLKSTETTHFKNGRIHAKEYLFPKSWVKIRKTRKLTGERLKKAQERFKKVRELSSRGKMRG